jgi:spore germination protein YaaH
MLTRIFAYIILFTIASSSLCLGQIKDQILKKVESSNPPKKKEEPPANTNPNNPTAEKKTEATNKDGKAAFVTNPDLQLDPNAAKGVNTMTPGGEKKEDEVKLEGNARIIDTVLFKARMSVKRRDMILYRKGLQNSTPFIHTNSYLKKRQLDPAKKVFGWHPYWMGEAYKSYNFSLLSAIAYFSYEVNPNSGEYLEIHDWQKTPMIDLAHKSGCKVLLSVSNFGEKNNETFLKNPSAQNNLIENVIELLLERKGDGVHLDFEQVPLAQKNAFTNFVIDFASKLKSKIKGAWFTMSLPAVDFGNVYDIQQLNGQVNLFIINGFEFYGANSEKAGPVSLAKGGGNWWAYSLDRSIDEYLAAGAEPAKLIVATTLYGAEWVTKDLKYPSPSRKFVNYMLYRDIKKKVGFAGTAEDPEGLSNIYAYRDMNGNYRQIWYDDSSAIAKKCDWIASKKIGGIGLWALGYDNGYPKIWEALANKMAVAEKTAKTKSVIKSPGFLRRFMSIIIEVLTDPEVIMKKPRIFYSLFLMFAGMSGGLGYVLYRYSCSFGRMTNLLLKGSFATFLMLLIFILAMAFQLTNVSTALWILGGFLVGIIFFLILTRSFLSEKELP